MTPSRTLMLAGCLLAAAPWLVAQPTAPPPPPTPVAAKPAPPDLPPLPAVAPVATPEPADAEVAPAPPAAPRPALAPVAAPEPDDLDVPPAPAVLALTPSAQEPLVIPARAPRAPATPKGLTILPPIDIEGLMDSVTTMQIDTQKLAEQARKEYFDQSGQWSAKTQDLIDKAQEKAWEAEQKYFAQTSPTPKAYQVPNGRGAIGFGPAYGGRGINIFGKNASADRLYEAGKSYLDSHRFEDALSAFNEVIARGGGGPVEGATYYKAYTLNRLGRRDEAVTTIAGLRKDYPNSRWLDDAKALEIEVKQASGKPVSPDELNDDDLKILALNGLMQTDPERAYPILEGIIKGAHSPQLKLKAVYVLAQNSSPKAQALLEQIARGSTGNPDLQVRAISYFTDTRNKPERAQLLADVYGNTADNSVKNTIISAFRRSNDYPHLAQIAKAEKNNDLRDQAIRALGDVDGQPELWTIYASETTTQGKQELLNVMMQNGNTEKIAEVARTDKDPAVRKTAVRVLASNKGANVTAALVGLYGTEQDPAVRKQIVSELASQRDAKSLIDIARKEKDVDMKRYIVSRLINIHTPEVNDFLLEILK